MLNGIGVGKNADLVIKRQIVIQAFTVFKLSVVPKNVSVSSAPHQHFFMYAKRSFCDAFAYPMTP